MVTKQTSADLKAKYNRVLELSVIVALVVVIAAFKFSPGVAQHKVETIVCPADDILRPEDIPSTNTPKPLPPPVPKIPIEDPTVKVLDDVDIAPSELDPNAPAGPPKFKEYEDERVPYIIAEDDPKPVGGMEAIVRLLVYPEIAKRAGVEGVVNVVAFVDESGKVVKTEVLTSIGAGCEEAAVYAIANTKFIPGKQQGKTVKARVAIPIRFTLTK